VSIAIYCAIGFAVMFKVKGKGAFKICKSMVICMRVYCAQCIPLCAAEVHTALHVQNSVCVCCRRSSVASLIQGVGTCSLLTIVLTSAAAAAAAALMVVVLTVEFEPS
jgi:hypothetical protein